VFERANIGKDGCIGLASSIMDQKGAEEIISKAIETKELTEVRTVTESLSKDERVDEANAYDEMLSQIDQNMRSSNVSTNNSNNSSIESLLDRTYKGMVGENVLNIPPKGEVETNLYLQDDDYSLDLKKLLKFRARVTSNEYYKYYNNCYEIEEQTRTIVNGICRASRSTKPCVKVKIRNPRAENLCLKKDSPLALVKVCLDVDKDTSRPTKVSVSAEEPPAKPAIISVEEAIVAPPPLVPTPSNFNPEKYFQRVQRKYSRKWDLLCAENAFQKSLLVEVKYPYFKKKPKVPFGLQDLTDLNMRVGISQDSKPVKVLDKINGVFTCTICDVVILDRFSLQDHWYSAKHKNSIKLVQVIAGPEERLAMNRPIAQEMFDQFNLCPLVGVEHITEVVAAPAKSQYNCSLCTLNLHVSELISHLTSLNHILTFIKKYFPVAWARFSIIPDFTNWFKTDFECLEMVITKIDEVHGRKRPSIVENSSKLEESIEKMTSNSYSARRTELDKFFRSLKPAEERQATPAAAVPGTRIKNKIENRVAVTRDTIEVAPASRVAVTVQIVDAPPRRIQSGRFVKVFKSPVYRGPCDIMTGFSRVWSETSKILLKVTVINKESTSSIILEGSELVAVTM